MTALFKYKKVNYSKKNLAELLRIYRDEPDSRQKEKVRTLIVSEMYPVIRHIAKTIARRQTDPIDDMVQAGFIGLLKAIDKYDEGINDNFRVYSGYLIIGEMKHYLRDKLKAIRVPRHIHELSIRIYNFTNSLTYEELRDLTSEEVAVALNANPEAVKYAMQVERRANPVSLEDLYKSDEHNLSFEEVLSIENYNERTYYEDTRIVFEDVVNKLPPEYKVLVDMHYAQGYSKKEIANAMLLSEMAVNRRMKQAYEFIADLVAEARGEENPSFEI